jgi:hypothetical protein
MNKDCEIQNLAHLFDFRKQFQILEGKTKEQIQQEDKEELENWNKAINNTKIIKI